MGGNSLVPPPINTGNNNAHSFMNNPMTTSSTQK